MLWHCYVLTQCALYTNVEWVASSYSISLVAFVEISLNEWELLFRCRISTLSSLSFTIERHFFGSSGWYFASFYFFSSESLFSLSQSHPFNLARFLFSFLVVCKCVRLFCSLRMYIAIREYESINKMEENRKRTNGCECADLVKSLFVIVNNDELV